MDVRTPPIRPCVSNAAVIRWHRTLPDSDGLLSSFKTEMDWRDEEVMMVTPAKGLNVWNWCRVGNIVFHDCAIQGNVGGAWPAERKLDFCFFSLCQFLKGHMVY